jgi:ferrous iron transport protein B
MLASLRLGFGSGAAAFAYLLFVLVYSPCLAALAVLAREAGGRWMLFSVCYQNLLAWMVATAFYQTATFQAHPHSSAAWLAGIVLLAAAGFLLLRRYGRRILALTNQ